MTWSKRVVDLLGAAQISFTNECAPDMVVKDLSADSRSITKGGVFCACSGSSTDGRQYLKEAEQKGAALILAEANGFDAYGCEQDLSTPLILVADLQNRLGLLAHIFFDKPSDSLQVFGVTGTNGKTTCCYLLAQAFSALGNQAGVIGTLGYGAIGAIKSGSLTTPDVVTVHRQLAELLNSGFTQVCMEVSSHALDQGRVASVNFFCTLFTNLTHDHLDYHGDMANYGRAKQRLFNEYHSKLSIINADDEFGASLPAQTGADYVVTYGDCGDVKAEDVNAHDHGLNFIVTGNGVDFELSTSLIGRVNVANLLLLSATLLGLSVETVDIQAIVSGLRPAPGRMELFKIGSSPSVVVDYAHTPDALEKALISLREHCEGKLWCVFGCGGDRDTHKRPLMGQIAYRYADHTVVTNDNPRSEAPQSIAEDIIADIGVSVSSADVAVTLEIILDRAAAIQSAIARATYKDIVLVAGKGHESTQTTADQVLAFSDRDFVTQVLEKAA